MIAVEMSPDGMPVGARLVAADYQAMPNETLVAGDALPDLSAFMSSGQILTIARIAARARIDSARAGAIAGGVQWGGRTWDSDDSSRANLTGAVAAFSAGVPVPAGFVWRTRDNVDVPMTLVDLVALAAAMLDHVNAQYARSWLLKSEIDAAQDVASVEAVAW